jgi:hypothetical protein
MAHTGYPGAYYEARVVTAAPRMAEPTPTETRTGIGFRLKRAVIDLVALVVFLFVVAGLWLIGIPTHGDVK